ncbi:MAG: nucleotidyltransferase domain-containing protein [bacterium]
MARIPDSPEEIFEEFTGDFQTAYGSDLVSIILYGSGARGQYVANRSDMNFLIVLSENGIDRLEKSLEFISKWQKINVAVPLFLTENYIRSALDTFPLEFLDMKNGYRLVSGKDVLKDIEIKKEDLRRQIERELRGKLIQLRAGFLSTGADREQLRGMLAASVSTFVSIFAGMLHLKDEEIPTSRTQIFEKTARLFGLDATALTPVLAVKSGQLRGSKVQLQEICLGFIRQIRQLVEIVDKM